MPTILTSSQQTFVDITDQRKLSAYITSNLPKTQSEDPNVLPHVYAPSWATSHLVLTPVIFLDQTNVALNASGLTISWKRKDGTGAETALTAGEAVSGGILTVSQNKLSDSSSGMSPISAISATMIPRQEHGQHFFGHHLYAGEERRKRQAGLCDRRHLCVQVQYFFRSGWSRTGYSDGAGAGCGGQ